MSDIAIKVSGLGKEYKLGTKKSGSFRESFSSLWKKEEKKAEETFWALQDIDFEIKKGEAIGIIGSNGAGKSTLLKILSRITEPTKGRIEINGRMASLLEVGTGFHPELTGRENIFLNGTILGMKRHEVKSKFDEIVAFSGVEKFIDTPVKHYSSGMYVRLAFAVAAHLEPEILVIDEVLAVGDAEFQKKCLGKMEDVTNEGRTVIFVSHNMLAIKTLCSKGILLKSGTIEGQGGIDDTINQYLQNNHQGKKTVFKQGQKEVSNDFVSIKSIEIVRNSMNNIKIDQNFNICSTFIYHGVANQIHVNYFINGEFGENIFVTSSVKINVGKENCFEVSCEFPSNLFNTKNYHIDMMVVENSSKPVIKADNIFQFSGIELQREFGGMKSYPGLLRPKCIWNYKTIINE